MAILNHNEMPMSLTGRALLWGATTDLLNPPNKGQDLAEKIFEKPLRCIARFIFQFAIAILGPFGMIYHFASALNYMIESVKSDDPDFKKKVKCLAWEHFKAGLHDLSTILLLGARTPFFLDPNSSVSYYMSSSLVKCQLFSKQDIANIKKQDPNPHTGSYSESHPENLSHMNAGDFKFDELIHRALWVREETGALPLLEDKSVHYLCFKASLKGVY